MKAVLGCCSPFLIQLQVSECLCIETVGCCSQISDNLAYSFNISWLVLPIITLRDELVVCIVMIFNVQ